MPDCHRALISQNLNDQGYEVLQCSQNAGDLLLVGQSWGTSTSCYGARGMCALSQSLCRNFGQATPL